MIIVDPTRVKLGKREPKRDARTLKLARFVNELQLPPVPQEVDWSRTAGRLGMMLNDRLGDCTIAGVGHMIQSWSGAVTGKPVVLPDDIILQGYEDWCGYKFGDQSTDNGGIEIDVLNRWRKDGLGGHKILGYAAVDPRNVTHVKASIAFFGGLYLGVGLPITAQAQDRWQLLMSAGSDAELYSWGGHCVVVVGYSDEGLLCITWGGLTWMTWPWFWSYCDEAYVCASLDFANGQRQAPSGIDMNGWQDAIVEVSA